MLKLTKECLNNQDDTDYLGKGPSVGQSVPETFLGLQNIEFIQQCTRRAGTTKIIILIILLGNLRISGYCNDLLL